MITVNQLYKDAVKTLSDFAIDSAEFEARLLVQKVSSYSYSDFLLNKNSAVSDERVDELNALISKRCDGIPLQYLLGKWDFMELTFTVGKGVLIPRPETEEICDYVISKIKSKKKPIVFDLCSGSGCIGLSIKHHVPQSDVYLFEYSDEALKYLNDNRLKLGFSKNVPAIKGDVLRGYDAFAFLPKPDVIISNPPYINSDEISFLQKEVLFEPSMALDGGADGLDFYRCFAEKWIDHINEGGFIAVECGEDQARKIADLFFEHSKKVEIICDFNSIERFVVAYK